jgi:predicted porin
MYRAFLMLTAGLTAALPATAQEFTYGGVEANYRSYDVDGTSVDMGLFAADLGFTFGQGFDGWVDVSSFEVDVDDLDLDLGLGEVTLGLGYTLPQNIRGDVSVTRLSTDLDIAGLGASDHVTMGELGVAYDNGTTFGRLSYTGFDDSDDLGIDNLWGLHVGYEGPQGLSASVSAHWVNDEFDVIDQPLMIASLGYDSAQWQAELDLLTVEVADFDITVWSLTGEYDFTANWSGFGSYMNLATEGLDADVIRLGGAYNFNERTRVYADVSRLSTSLSDDDIDGFGIGIAMDLGEKPASYETTADRLSKIDNGLFSNGF